MENIKQKAIEFLVTYNLGELPKNLLKLNTYSLGFKILTYAEGRKIIEYNGWQYYAKNYDGFTVCMANGEKLIFYNEKLAYSEKNIVITHEIGHIVLEHTIYSQILGKSKNKSDKNSESLQEREADAFALALLAPPAVLLELNCCSPREISKVTGLPLDISELAAVEVMNEKTMRKTKLESRLLDVFKESIEKYRFISDEKKISSTENTQAPIIIHLSEEKKVKSKINNWVVICIFSSCVVIILSIFIANHSVNLITNQPNTYISEENTKQLNHTDITVYVSSTKKYHLKNCRFAKDGISTPLSEAVKNNYTPCKFCNPNK